MKRVEIFTIYEHIARLNARRIELVSQHLDHWEEFEDGETVERYKLRPREGAFVAQLEKMDIYCMTPESVSGVPASKAKKDLCVVAGEVCSQSVTIAAQLRKARFRMPLFIEITEEEAVRKSSLNAAVTVARRHGVEDLLLNLVYLTRDRKSPRSVELDISESTPSELPAARRKPKANVTVENFRDTSADIAEPPARVAASVTRVIRDTKTAGRLKQFYEFRCQVCGTRLELLSGKFYAEVHHVRPLGGAHKGLDRTDNMLVLCPNHHAMFDFGIPKFVSADCVKINSASHQLTTKHKLGAEVISYHNASIHSP